MNKLKLYGKTDSPEMYPIRDFLRRSVVDYELFDTDDKSNYTPEDVEAAKKAGDQPAIRLDKEAYASGI